MEERSAVLALFDLMALCGGFIAIIMYISPNPMPALHAQVLTALVGIFVAAGYALIKKAGGSPRGSSKSRKPPEADQSPNT
jgi:hypothetical protein